MEVSKFTVSRFAYFILAGIWIFSIGIIILSSYFTKRLLFSRGWFIFTAIFRVGPLIVATSSTWGIFQQSRTIIEDEKIKQPNLMLNATIIEWKEITKAEKKDMGDGEFSQTKSEL